ncbi:MAG: DUF488 domain-containing protein [bacterium]|nr:DUF488 domain-containing protein [bacterium]MDE0287466.1 DUF488 domain-containing protein [bacterium]MDE0437640.1 DUF488 domain-containing protein [bacterium]
MSIGHSIHPIEVFVELLRGHGVGSVADVRTSPCSRFNSQFNRHALERDLQAVGIRYLFLGEALGGRPEGDRFYDHEGHVLYGRIAESRRFESGLSRLVEQSEHSRVAVMCSEENPAGCHRFLLVTRALHGRGVEVVHIRGDGSTQRTDDVDAFRGWSDPVYENVSLLDGSVCSSWRSIRPVTHRGSV